MTFTASSLCWLETVLEERFGHQFDLVQQASSLLLSLPGKEGVIRFDRLEDAFHQSRSDFPCQQWQASVAGYTAPIDDWLPAPSSTELPSSLIEQSDNNVTIHYDILGLTYWMLSRLEEVGRTDLDNHGRFPATSSHAFQHDYLERPIVDEWLVILGQVIQRVWPQLELKVHEFRMKVSHDVDNPSLYGFHNVKGLVRHMGGNVLKRRDIKGAVLAPWVWFNTRHRIHPLDPANTFDWIMDQSEQQGLVSAFYFICGRTDPTKDALYEPEHPAVRELMRRIHERGHEIGLHPSYNTYQSPKQILKEANRLRRICSEEGIEQDVWGGRMHYLRWEQPTTLRSWDEANMNYDSTLGYADRPGFRCGTCFEYPAFDPILGQVLKLRTSPLIAMDCTVMDRRYLDLGERESAFLKFKLLKDTCYKLDGVFALLWHNTRLEKESERKLYKRILAA